MARRSRLSRYLTIAFILFITPIFVFGATVALTGFVTVEVHQKSEGVDLYIPFPAILLDLAIMVAPMVIPDDAMDDARREIAPYQEAIEGFAEELEGIPSGVLVEFESENEHVLVTKSWRSFQVNVESEEADVNVKVPARLMSRALDVL